MFYIRQKGKRKLADFDESSGDDSQMNTAEVSRPARGFKETARKKNKPAGRKRENEHKTAVRVNWFQPVLFSGIRAAAERAGKPWSPLEIVKQAQSKDSVAYKTLTPQVVGRWFCPEAATRGESEWRESVLLKVQTGNAPGGQSTRSGILVCEISDCMDLELILV